MFSISSNEPSPINIPEKIAIAGALSIGGALLMIHFMPIMPPGVVSYCALGSGAALMAGGGLYLTVRLCQNLRVGSQNKDTLPEKHGEEPTNATRKPINAQPISPPLEEPKPQKRDPSTGRQEPPSRNQPVAPPVHQQKPQIIKERPSVFGAQQAMECIGYTTNLGLTPLQHLLSLSPEEMKEAKVKFNRSSARSVPYGQRVEKQLDEFIIQDLTYPDELNLPNQEGKTALEVLVEDCFNKHEGRQELLGLLFQAKASITSQQHGTLLHLALKNEPAADFSNQKDCFNKILSAAKEENLLDFPDAEGNTPFHLAKNENIGKKLLDAGATSVSAINKAGETPLEYHVNKNPFRDYQLIYLSLKDMPRETYLDINARKSISSLLLADCRDDPHELSKLLSYDAILSSVSQNNKENQNVFQDFLRKAEDDAKQKQTDRMGKRVNGSTFLATLIMHDIKHTLLKEIFKHNLLTNKEFEELFASDPDLLLRKNTKGDTLLHVLLAPLKIGEAIDQQHRELIRTVIQLNNDTLTIKNRAEERPLGLICTFSDDENLINLVLQNVKNHQAECDKEGNKPIHLAVLHHRVRLMNFFFSEDYSVRFPNSKPFRLKNGRGETPFHCAFRTGNFLNEEEKLLAALLKSPIHACDNKMNNYFHALAYLPPSTPNWHHLMLHWSSILKALKIRLDTYNHHNVTAGQLFAGVQGFEWLGKEGSTGFEDFADDFDLKGKTQKEEQKARKILQVDQMADLEEIKKSYRNLARTYHPDMQKDKTEEEKKIAEEKFKEISVAYEVLGGHAVGGK